MVLPWMAFRLFLKLCRSISADNSTYIHRFAWDLGTTLINLFFVVYMKLWKLKTQGGTLKNDSPLKPPK